jgi:hypothetical protein
MLTHAEIDVVLDQVSRGNRDGFRLIVRAFSLPLRCYIASQVHHPNDVEDITQEVFLSAYRQLGTFRRGDDFGAWLRGIARNKLHGGGVLQHALSCQPVAPRLCSEGARMMKEDLSDLLSAWLGREIDPARCGELLARLRVDDEFRQEFVPEIRMYGMLRTVQSAEPRWLRLEDDLGWSERLSMRIRRGGGYASA